MQSPLLDVLPPEERRRLLSMARRRRYGRREVVFHEGDPGEALHVIDKGHVGIRRTTPLGDVAMLLVLGPGEVFGELAVLAPAPRNATVFAIDVVETLILHRTVFDELRSRQPGVDRVLIQVLAAEVRRLSGMLVDALYVPADKRVILRLWDLTRIFDPGDADKPVVIPLTQEELGQLAGTTRPTANRVLRATEEQGIVRMSRGRIEVLDRAAVAKQAR